MNKIKFVLIGGLLVSSFCFLNSAEVNFAEGSSPYVVATSGCKSGSLPTKLDLNRCSEEEIRSYYSSLNSLDASKRSGTNALQYLKPILYEMNYFTYDQVSDIYAITDRDWVHSPTLYSGTFDQASNTVTGFVSSVEANQNPYITMLYVDYTKVESTHLKNDAGNANFDKEHVWCQSRGFKASSGAKGPAGTDLHHLISGDSYTNQTLHNNNPYGFVNSTAAKGNKDYTVGNLRGAQKHTSPQDESTVVFEPIDECKGDIARAIFYMMARYNNISGKDTITQFEPNLQIVNYATSNGSAEESSASKPVTIGILSDLLAWNKIDPVSDFEIYRNDLIYRNYQGNRNPFIDYPEWIDAIWGTADLQGENYSSTPVGVIDPQNDKIYGESSDTPSKKLVVSLSSLSLDIGKNSTIYASGNDSTYSWSISDTSIATIDKVSSGEKENITVTAIKAGTTYITVSTEIDGELVSKQIQVNVNEEKVIDHGDSDDDIFDDDFVIDSDMIMYALIVLAILIIIFIFTTVFKKKKKKKTTKKRN